MKVLRILTGIHAGGSLPLTPGRHRVGPDDDADIHLADWQGPDAHVDVDETGVVSISRDLPGDAEADAVLLIDFVPVQFDDTVLCLGPEDTAWPSDLDLLSILLASPVKSPLASLRHQRRRRRQLTAVAACVLLGGVITAGALVITMQISDAAFPPSANDRTLRISQALAESHLAGLHAVPLGNSVAVTGMVASTSDAAAVRALLARVAPDGIVRNYDVAQEDVRSIQDSLGVAGARVSYAGNGRFVISGHVADKTQLDAAVARVRSDLDSNVKALLVQADQVSRPGPELAVASYSEMVSSEDVRYAETPDGIKHIFAVDLPGTLASSDPASGSPLVSGAGDANAEAEVNADPAGAYANPSGAPARAPAPTDNAVLGGAPLEPAAARHIAGMAAGKGAQVARAAHADASSSAQIVTWEAAQGVMLTPPPAASLSARHAPQG
ncbi:type III secretion protein [Paraburkholderia sp. EG287B]|uniref:type III secretion protein n=1 Tax=unclassified Paraburkholderia TaxID=2615204 RepID=UPI0034D22A72